jgi:hypothetical protein
VIKKFDFLPPAGYPVSMTIPETMAFAKTSRSGVYKAIGEGRYKVIKHGPRTTRILTLSVLEDMESTITGQATAAARGR